jgi:fructokinase
MLEAYSRPGILHFGSIPLINQPARGATLHAGDCAISAGCVISYDPNLRPALWPDVTSTKEGL